MAVAASGCCTTMVAISAIVIGAIGLAGGMSLHSVSVGSLVTSVLNPLGGGLQFIISIIGLTGSTTVGVVSGVTLGTGIVTFIVSSVACCCGAAAGA